MFGIFYRFGGVLARFGSAAYAKMKNSPVGSMILLYMVERGVKALFSRFDNDPEAAKDDLCNYGLLVGAEDLPDHKVKFAINLLSKLLKDVEDPHLKKRICSVILATSTTKMSGSQTGLSSVHETWVTNAVAAFIKDAGTTDPTAIADITDIAKKLAYRLVRMATIKMGFSTVTAKTIQDLFAILVEDVDSSLFMKMLTQGQLDLNQITRNDLAYKDISATIAVLGAGAENDPAYKESFICTVHKALDKEITKIDAKQIRSNSTSASIKSNDLMINWALDSILVYLNSEEIE